LRRAQRGLGDPPRARLAAGQRRRQAAADGRVPRRRERRPGPACARRARSRAGEGSLAHAVEAAPPGPARAAGLRAAQRLEIPQRPQRGTRHPGGAQPMARRTAALGRGHPARVAARGARARSVRRRGSPAPVPVERGRGVHRGRTGQPGRADAGSGGAGAHRRARRGGRGVNAPDTPRDPYLDLPLHGVRLIEASAGTGKTFTLATLVTRLVVERGLRIGQVLAVTFTEAATQELRKRIRERLLLALRVMDTPQATDEDAEAALTRDILHAHLARSGETTDALRRRLHQAALEIDLAAIFTIHGFCARVLREHALESGQGFDPLTLLANDRDLREELAADLWRTHGKDDASAEDLTAMWKGGPPKLAEDLRALLAEPRLLPPLPPAPVDDPTDQVLATGRALAEGFREHGHALLAAVLDALERKVLNGGSYKAAWIQPFWEDLAAWCEGGDYTAPLDERLERFTLQAMRDKANSGQVGNVPDSPLCALIEAHVAALRECAAWREQRRVALRHRIRDDARVRLARLKRQRRLQTYDDLIDGVADALDGDGGEALARGLRAQYAVALVDEFQDTDARQWKIFERVFGTRSGDPALFLIGDPKQAIYGFRGGDVHAYLQAREDADEAPALAHNFRSRPAVLSAIAALYGQAGDKAFVDERIRFRQVEPGGKRRDDEFQREGQVAPALTVWQAPEPPPGPKGKPGDWNAEESRVHCTQACVAAIHAVLSEGRAGSALLEGKPVAPGDIAVLVRTHSEATRIQQALAAVGIPAVAAGKQSLYATHE